MSLVFIIAVASALKARKEYLSSQIVSQKRLHSTLGCMYLLIKSVIRFVDNSFKEQKFVVSVNDERSAYHKKPFKVQVRYGDDSTPTQVLVEDEQIDIDGNMKSSNLLHLKVNGSEFNSQVLRKDVAGVMLLFKGSPFNISVVCYFI